MDSICQYLGTGIRSWVAGKSSAAAPGSSESSERVSDLPAGRYVIPKMERSTRQIILQASRQPQENSEEYPHLATFVDHLNTSTTNRRSKEKVLWAHQ